MNFEVSSLRNDDENELKIEKFFKLKYGHIKLIYLNGSYNIKDLG